MVTIEICIIAYGDVIRIKHIKILSSTSVVPQSQVKETKIQGYCDQEMENMGDMNDVCSGRSLIRRARPLFLRLNEWRRRMEQELEIRPGRGRGPGD